MYISEIVNNQHIIEKYVEIRTVSSEHWTDKRHEDILMKEVNSHKKNTILKVWTHQEKEKTGVHRDNRVDGVDENLGEAES